MPLRPAERADAAWISLLDTLDSSAPFGVGLIDLDWRFVRVNETLAAMNGRTVEEHRGSSLAGVVPDLWPQVEPVLVQMVESGADAYTYEFAGASPVAPGRHGNWLNTFYPVRAGDELVAIGFIVLDLTEHRQAQRLQAVIMGAIDEGLIALDAEGRVTCLNMAAEQMLGWSEQELRGDDAAERIGMRMRGPAVRSFEESLVCRDGRVLPVLCTATREPGGGVVILFRDANEESERRRRAERELDALDWVRRVREALEEDRLELYSQPIVPLEGSGSAREELLLRMRTQDGDIIGAGEFIPAVESFGLITAVDRWVISRAVRYAARGRVVHVNLSAASTSDPRLLNLIAYELRAVGTPPANIIFELTETALMSNAAGGEAFVAGLRALGCGLALDDFGTGFGGFTYLKRLPVQVLKIDVDFVRDLARNAASRHLVQAIVSLARSFGKETIAEGVEDEVTLALLREYGVDYAQGYHLGRPAPIPG
jgi:PAS domain S-box-containing protein